MKAMIAKQINLENLFAHKPLALRPIFLAQPKIYGVRGIWDAEKQELFTRQNNIINSLRHITYDLRYHKLSQYPLEGELYSEEINFEELQGIIRQGMKASSNHFLNRIFKGRVGSVKLYIFDLIEPKMRAINRKDFLDRNFTKTKNIFLLPSFLIKTEEEARDFYNKCLEEGFEGAVFRKTTLKYNERGGLLKVKPNQDMICTLKDWKEKDVLILEHDSREFYCSGMSKRTKETIWKEYSKGSNIPIKYDRLTKYGIPFFARVNNELIS